MDNDTKGQTLADNDPSWKSKKWWGYKNNSGAHHNRVSSSFEIHYLEKTHPFKFPFFSYLKTDCMGTHSTVSESNFANYCTTFDIPTDELQKHLKNPTLQERSNPKNICFENKRKERGKAWWEKKECISGPNSN